MALADLFSWTAARGRGRPAHEPARDTLVYPRLTQIGGQTYARNRPMIKPTPANLRRFSRTVYARRAIKLIKDPISAMDWEIGPKEGIERNSVINEQCETLEACFRRPNHDDSFSTMVEQCVEDMMVCGAFALEHQKGGDALRPLWMWPTDALSIQIYTNWNGNNDVPRYFQAYSYGASSYSKGQPLRNDELVYGRIDPTTDNPFGLGPIEVAFQTINRLLGASDYAGNVASNATPQTLLFFKDLDEASINSIRQYWQNEVEGQGKIPIFGGNAEAKDIKMHGGDDSSLFLKWHEVLIREIAAAAGLSPANFSIERDVNRDTAEVGEDRDWRITIIPLAKNFAGHINREIIEEKLGYSQIEFRFKGLERLDELATARIFEIYHENDVMTANEIRNELDMVPSTNPFANLLKTDAEIAKMAARSAGLIEDPALPKQTPAPAPAPAKPVNKPVIRRNRSKG